MTLNVRVPLISSELDYTMAFHISSYTDQSYTISLQDENGREYASAQNIAGVFQSCVKKGEFEYDIPKKADKAIYIQLDGGDETPKYLISQISANEGTSEVDNVYFSDNGVNYYALVVRFVRFSR